MAADLLAFAGDNTELARLRQKVESLERRSPPSPKFKEIFKQVDFYLKNGRRMYNSQVFDPYDHLFFGVE